MGNKDNEELLAIIDKILASGSGRLDISDFCNYRISKMLCERPSWCDDCLFDNVNTRKHNLIQFRIMLQHAISKDVELKQIIVRGLRSPNTATYE
jgi:hypothetical protein